MTAPDKLAAKLAALFARRELTADAAWTAWRAADNYAGTVGGPTARAAADAAQSAANAAAAAYAEAKRWDAFR